LLNKTYLASQEGLGFAELVQVVPCRACIFFQKSVTINLRRKKYTLTDAAQFTVVFGVFLEELRKTAKPVRIARFRDGDLNR
jgi:hypothetical protein